MINTELLDAYIENSGLKTNYIAKALGMTDSVFRKKRKNEVRFSVYEVCKLCDILNIGSDKSSVFFS